MGSRKTVTDTTGTAHDGLLDRDLVIVLVEPGESAPDGSYRFGRISLAHRTHRRVLSYRQRLEWAGLNLLHDAPGAVNVHAAEHNQATN